MYLELSSGRDNFREQTSTDGKIRSPRRAVTITNYICTPTLPKFMPVYAAAKEKVQGLGSDKVLSSVDASTKTSLSPGKWFNTRYEVVPGTLFVLEHVQMSSIATSLNRATTYMLILASDVAPLWQLTVALPPHFMATVNNVQFRGRFEIIESYTRLLELVDREHADKVLDHFGIEQGEFIELDDYIGADMWGDVFRNTMLEGPTVDKVKIRRNTKTQKVGGIVSTELRRVRRIKVRR